MLLKSFLKEVSISVKLTDSVISRSRNAAININFNLKYLVSC